MRRSLLISLALAIATAAIYAPVVGHPFLRLDDDKYVTANTSVQAGLSAKGFAWAFATDWANNWHPLTWLSHMLDYEMYGAWPGGHHLTSLLLHVVNVVLLFFALQAMTRACWPSAMVAALFALHPLHVESVAWVAERKDVLSGMFAILCLWAWSGYARRGGVGLYLLAALFLALGLLAKPMLVTLPVVLLLLDFWPLDRTRTGPGGRATSPRILVLEKIPLLLLCLGSSVITLVVQSGGAVRDLDSLPVAQRVANAVVAYAGYLRRMVWPEDLAVFYPHPYLEGSGLDAMTVLGSAIVLTAVSAAVVISGRRYAWTGWLWFLVTLVPVIGFVQVGLQAMADRYTYLPMIGPFIIVVWAAVEVARRLDGRRALPWLGAAVLLVCAAATWNQLRYWRSSITLFEHSLAAAPGSSILHNNLGIALAAEGRLDEAIAQFQATLDIDPDQPDALFNLGNALILRGRNPEAVAPLEALVRTLPENASAHYRLGIALRESGHADRAIREFELAARLKPGWEEPLQAAAWILATHWGPEVRDPDRALSLIRQAIDGTPRPGSAVLDTLAAALAATGRFAEAVDASERALRQLDPALPAARSVRARLELYREGQPFTMPAPSP